MVHVMSEVHRYKVQCMFGEGGSKIEYFPHGPSIVMAEAFDAQRLRADTAEAEVARLEDEFDTLENTNTTIKLKLAAAEQRIAQHETMLRHFASCADVRQVGTLAMDYVAALNPNPNPEAESHE